MSDLINKIHCMDYQQFLPLLLNDSVNVVITDPPYGISYQNNYTHKIHNMLVGDQQSFDYLFLAFQSHRVLKNNSAFLCFTGWSEYPDHFKQIKTQGFLMKEPIICQKRASGKTDLYGTFQTNADWCIFAHKGKFSFQKTCLIKNKKAGVIPNKGRKPVPEFKTRLPSCWFGNEYPWSTENPVFQKKHNIYHPTIKSLEFIKWLILLTTQENDIVLDPFMGSGTTAVACKLLNRQFIGCEINPTFCEYWNQRLQMGV